MNFEEWLNDGEVPRVEQFFDELFSYKLDSGNVYVLVEWLKMAYKAGYTDASFPTRY